MPRDPATPATPDVTGSSAARTCPGCGAPLKAGALDGLCARCLLGAMMTEPPALVTSNGTDRFGDYELLGVIARGGSGVVHRARHVELDRVVALKILPHELDGDATFVERFRTEAAAAASLEHPHIVPVYDFGGEQGRHFLAMKLIDGTAATQRMSVADAARRLVIIARAVHHAHQRGVIHRDLKPANILIDAKGEPHLTDFGLAKLTARDSTITRTRAVLGTPAYMSPEQAAGNAREITTAADVYGLGAVLYHWLTGTPPFAGGTTVETIRQVIDRDPEPPSRRNPTVDRDMETICLKCLRKEPAQRYASADALAADLERWSRHEPVLARRIGAVGRMAKWVRRNRVLAFVTGTSLAALVTAAVVLGWQNAQLKSARREISGLAEKQRGDLVRLHVATGNRLAAEGDGYAALASFAEAAALDAGEPERLEMHRFRFAATLAQLPALEYSWKHEGAVHSAVFNEAGTRAVTASADRTARVWDVQTGSAAAPPLPHAGPVWWAGFAAGDTRLITRARTGEIHLWDAATGAPAAGPFAGRKDMPAIVDGLAKAVTVSPDGLTFAVLKERSVEIRRTSDGSPARDPLPCSQQPGCVIYSPDGSELAVVCEEGAASVFNAASGMLVRSIPTRELAGKASPHGWRSGAWSPDGARLALTDRVFAARVLPADLSRVSSPLRHDFMVLGAAWTKDSQRLLTWSYDNTVRVWDPDTLQPVLPPVRHRGPVFDAAFSPDERWIASACRDGTARLWDPATGERHGPVLRHHGSVTDVDWSRDGARLLTAGGDGMARLWKVSGLAGPHREWAHSSAIESVVLSTDARLAAALILDRAAHVWDVDDGAKRAVLPHPSRPLAAAWSSATQLLTVTSDGTMREWELAGPSVVRTLTVRLATAEPAGFSLSPDAQWLAVNFKSSPAQLFSARDGRLCATVDARPAAHLLWSPCSRFLATLHVAAAGSEMVLTEISSGRTATPRVLNQGGGSPALDHGARRLAFCDSGYRVRIMNLANGSSTGPMPHHAVVRTMAFTPDGRVLVTGSHDGTLRLWDAATGEPLSPPLSHPSWIVSLAAHPDSRQFFTGTTGGRVSHWTIPAKRYTPAEMERIATGHPAPDDQPE